MKTRISILALSILLAACVTTAFAQNYDPHPDTVTYKEDYRGQYHFSPKSEWMNDINALVYQDGTYHMIYQWGKSIRHGGYATSKDLLHWTDEGVALVPEKTFLPKRAINVAGHQVYSGSGVIVKGETAKKITGSEKEAMVTIYTGTARGTCLAWSNDGGKSWHDYKANPVANPTKKADPRDPCVFWHEPTKTWINAIYERGTTFYGSKDLIQWEKLSNIRFGYECPDVFELPLDGDKSKMKWVLQDANGTYLVGHFDGKTFHKEQGHQIMDCGPDFYAAQTFFRPNLPTEDVIQIAWNDHWNGGVGERLWERNATFPVVIGLVTYDGKMRVTRTPIKAIEKLYSKTHTWKNETLQAGKNLLSDTKSKAFDMTAVFDLSNTTASEINFQIANVTLTYDIKGQQFIGMRSRNLRKDKPKPLKPDDNGMLKIRMLVDWAQLEAFSAGGVFSYSAHIPFTPGDSSLGLSSTGGDVKLVSLTLNEVKSIWPQPLPPDPNAILMTDFEGKDYGDWTATGNAFGTGPAKGKIGSQNPVSGFKGQGLVNTFRAGDASTGTLTSPEFKIERKYIRFYIGGGSHNNTCLQLLIDGKPVMSTSGGDNERLSRRFFDVQNYAGKKAQLRIVDENGGRWGHVNVDHITQTDEKR